MPPPPGVGAIKAPPAAAAPGASSLTPLSSPVSNSVDLLGGLDLSPLSLQQQPPSNPPVANLPQPASTQSKYAAALFSHFAHKNYSPLLLSQPYVSGQMTHGVPLRVLKSMMARFPKSGLASEGQSDTFMTIGVLIRDEILRWPCGWTRSAFGASFNVIYSDSIFSDYCWFQYIRFTLIQYNIYCRYMHFIFNEI